MIHPDITKRLNYLVGAISRISNKKLAEALGPLHIAPKHFAVLALVDGNDVNQITLAERLQFNRNVIVKLIDEMQEMNLVTRKPNPINRREYFIQLTEDGEHTLHKSDSVVLETERLTLEPLNEREKDTLCQLLSKIVKFHIDFS